MMSRYTKGPWIYGVRHDGSKWLSIGDYKTGPHYQGDLYASESDAKLICSAPDLLDALQALLERLQLDCEAKSWFPKEQDDARKAIAKALAQ
jgi:hypothetical protein